MANRSLQTQRQGTEVAGHNLANVNNPAYARQRVVMQTSLNVPTAIGPMGTGADVVAIQRLRDELTDLQIQRETSVRGSLASQQQVLQSAQASLGQSIDRQASGAEGSAAAAGIGGQHGIAENLSDFFNALHSLSTNPTSLTERQVLLMKAQNLTDQFTSVDARLDELRFSNNEKLEKNVEDVNLILADIAKLNEKITTLEVASNGFANDLRDSRQQQIEKLSEIIKIDTTAVESGAIDISIDGVQIVAGPHQVERLESYDAGGGQLLVRTQNGTALNPAGGSLHGLISVRDNELAQLQENLDLVAGTLITEINRIHTTGYGLNGTTGEVFFTGTDAASIRLNNVLLDDPSTLQASDESGANGNNAVALRMAQAGDVRLPGLTNQTLSENYAQTVAKLGQDLASLNTRIDDQSVVEEMLVRQRDSVSGVSMDEEMTDLIRFQRAFQASAKMVNTIDEMLETLINLKR